MEFFESLLEISSAKTTRTIHDRRDGTLKKTPYHVQTAKSNIPKSRFKSLLIVVSILPQFERMSFVAQVLDGLKPSDCERGSGMCPPLPYIPKKTNGDERKAIDEIMTKLRTLVAETGISLFLVSHLKRTTGTAHEDGGKISLQDLRGSQSIAQLSDIVIGMERHQQHEDADIRNTTTVRVLKNRYTGQTGPACWLRYDIDTGRMNEVPPPSKDDGGETEF